MAAIDTLRNGNPNPYFRREHLSNGTPVWQALNKDSGAVVGGVYHLHQSFHELQAVGLSDTTDHVYRTVTHGATRDYCDDPADPAFEEGWEKQRNRTREYLKRRKARGRRPSWLGSAAELQA